jgi:hypothetical protein
MNQPTFRNATSACTGGRRRTAKALGTAALVLQLASCGGGGDSSSGGTSGACERVSAGTSSLTVKNELASGLEAFLPQFAFGTDMAAGECNIVGLEYATASVAVRVELRQCTNTPGNTDCAGKLFGPTRISTILLARGESRTLTVNSDTFK